VSPCPFKVKNYADRIYRLAYLHTAYLLLGHISINQLAGPGYGFARLCATRIWGVPQMRPSWAWFPTGVLWDLVYWTPGGV